MPSPITTRVYAPFIDQFTNIDVLNLVNAAVNYGSNATLTTTPRSTLEADAADVRAQYKKVDGKIGEKWREKYKELCDALTGDETDSPARHPHTELVRRAENCFYGRTRMDTSDGRLHVGDSRFESWYADEYTPEATDTDKQHAREAYEAGMNDPITLIPSPTMARVNEWMRVIGDVINHKDASCLVDVKQEMYESLFGHPEIIKGTRIALGPDAALAEMEKAKDNGPVLIDETGDLTGIPGMNVSPGTTGTLIANIRSAAIIDLAHKTAHDRMVDHETADLMKMPSLHAVDEAINRYGAAPEIVKMLQGLVDQRDTAVERLDNLLLWCKEEAAKGVLAKLGPNSKDIETAKLAAALRGRIRASHTIAVLEFSGGFFGHPGPPPLSEQLKKDIETNFIAEELAKVRK